MHGWWSVCKSLNDNLCLVFTDCTEKETSEEEEQKSLKIILLELLVLSLTLRDSIELRIVV